MSSRTVAVFFNLLCTIFYLSGCGKPVEVPTSDPPLAHHALIVSIDGCRPDVLLRAPAKNIRQLMSEGSFTFWARTTAMSVTLPSHTSMLTGVPPEVHGISWNDNYEGPVIYPNVPTLFEIAKSKGLTTAIFSNKAKFVTLARPGSINWFYIETDTKHFRDDSYIAALAADTIREHTPNVTFVHLGATDVVGHGKYYWAEPEDQGWGSDEQVWAVDRADKAIGGLIQALKDAGIYDDTVIIISADHGGAGKSHGPDDPRSRQIPWICVGPTRNGQTVRHNYDLTRNRNLVVRTEDTFATVSYFLGLPINPNIQGRPVMQVLHERELLAPDTAPSTQAK